jgi:hypothetical protein
MTESFIPCFTMGAVHYYFIHDLNVRTGTVTLKFEL